MVHAHRDPRNFRRAALGSLICLLILCLLPAEKSESIRTSLVRALYPNVSILDDEILAYNPTFKVKNIPKYLPLLNDDGSESETFIETPPLLYLHWLIYATVNAMIPPSLKWIWVPANRYFRYSWKSPEITDILRELLKELLSSPHGILILANCVAIIILSTYYTTKSRDVHMPFEFHFKYGHTHGDNDNSRHREKEYWTRLNSSVEARNYLEVFWALRIASFVCVVLFTGPGGALACLLHHIMNLGFAIIPHERTAEEESSAANSSHIVASLVSFFISGIYLIPGLAYVFQWYTTECGRQLPRFTWMNNLPCVLCDEVKPDIKLEELRRSTATLGRFQEEMCRHCWGPWTEGEFVVVLRCGHVYHDTCCAEWFRTRGQRQCPLCRFEVSAIDYKRATRRRQRWTSEQIEGRIALIKPRPVW